jgi:hypothetical protein
MSALWMIGLLIAVISVIVFSLTLCRAAALADRDVELPKPAALPGSTRLGIQAEEYEINISQPDEQAGIYLEQISASS